MALASKAKYFTLAAAVLLMVAVLGIGRTVFDSARYKAQQDVRRTISNRVRDAEDAKRKLAGEQGRELESKGIIEQAYKPFEYREMVPKVIETVLSVLPNEENNNEQREVYEAFERGDVATLTKTPRNQRKQIFVTSMSVYYMANMEGVGIGGGSVIKEGGPASSSSDGGWQWELSTGEAGSQKMSTADSDEEVTDDSSVESDTSGFVVVIAGYTPYKDIGGLLDPAGVGDDKEKWGVVTRLMNLDTLSDANSPFELYGKTDVTHFQLQTGEVSLESPMPGGIGMVKDVRQNGSASEQIALVDPMTKEVISKVPLKDELGRDRLDSRGKKVYEVNDHWFVLKFKLLWRKSMSSETIEDV